MRLGRHTARHTAGNCMTTCKFTEPRNVLEEDWRCEVSYFAAQIELSLLLLSHTNSFIISHSLSSLIVARIHFSITYTLFSHNTLFLISCGYFCLCNLSRILCSTSLSAVCNAFTIFTCSHTFLLTDLYEDIIWTLNKTLQDVFSREREMWDASKWSRS